MNRNNSKITGIILAGGKSKRMGRDKSFISLAGRELIELVIDRLSPLCGELIIVTNNPPAYGKYGLRIITDMVKDKGPLGGIYTGLISSGSRYNLIAACDMPFINQELVKYMTLEMGGNDAVIAERNNRLQPLCAVYSKDCIPAIEEGLRANKLKITDFLKRVKVKKINEDEAAKLDPDGSAFMNINTTSTYEEAQGSKHMRAAS